MERKAAKIFCFVLMVVFLSCCVSYARVTWYTPYQWGIHTWTGGAKTLLSGKTGWCVQTILSTDSGRSSEYQNIINEGFHLIIRINWSYDPQQGTIPKNSSDWNQFASNCAARVNEYKEYCNVWIIGNEPNIPSEGNISCSNYCACFKIVRNAIKNVQPDAIVCAAGLSPTPGLSLNADNANYQNQGSNDRNYFWQMCNYLANDVDGYSLHTYGIDEDPRDDSDWEFHAYRKYISIMNQNAYARVKPVYVTETNIGGNDTESRYSNTSDWIKWAYEDTTWWNNNKQHGIQCLTWFVYYSTFNNWDFPGCSLYIGRYWPSQHPNLKNAYDDFCWMTANLSHWNQGPAFSSVWTLNTTSSDKNSMDWNKIYESTYKGAWTWSGDLINWNSGGVVETGVKDYFVVWQAKTFYVTTEGWHNFLTWSDDGSWLWIDGQIVVNNYGLHGPKTEYGWKYLKPGPHFLAFKMFEWQGGACAGYQWQQPNQTSYGQVPSCGALGATNVWALDTTNSNPDSNDPNTIYPAYFIGSIWWNGTRTTTAPLGRNDYFYIEQMRYFWAPTTGKYEFKTGSDDGSWLWVDGRLVVNNGGKHGYKEATGSINLTQGMHLLWFKMFEWDGGQEYMYQYKKPNSTVWEYIP